MLKGDLASFSLGEIFQSLAINNHTGTLKISGGNQSLKLIYFDRGEIRLFSDGSPEVPRIGELFLRGGKLTRQDIADALEEQKTSKQVLGEILVKKGLITSEDIKAALETQVREEIYDLFLMKEGSFEFHMGYFPEELSNTLQRKAGIALNTNSVIMEGLRRLDEWAVINKKISTRDEIFIAAGDDFEATDDLFADFLSQIDGTRTVRELFKFFPGTRFDGSKYLCQLLEMGAIRYLTADECRGAAAERMGKRAYQQAAMYLQFAAQLQPSDPSNFCRLGAALAAFHHETGAKEAYTKALRIQFEQGNYSSAVEAGEKVLAMGQLGEEDLEKLFQAYLGLKHAKKATSAGNQLASAFQKRGDIEKAASVLGTLASLDPTDLNLKIQVATLFEKAGDKKRAINYLEEVGATLQAAKKYKELIKILRLITDMNPDNPEFKARLSSTQDLLKKIEKRRKRRIRVCGASSIAFLILVGIPLIYEVKAREFLSHAQRLEQISMMSMDFKRAREAYEKLTDAYGFSTKVAEAQEALDRISAIERTFLERHEKETEKQKAEQEKKLAAMKEAFASAMAEAERAEKTGDLRKAHEVYRRIASEYSELPATRNILRPLNFTSDPAGAMVSVSGAEVGKTPFVLRYRPGATVNLTVSKKSCESVQKTIVLREEWELHFDLKRRPIGDFTVAPTIQQPMIEALGRVLLASRDGNLYAVDPVKKIVHWQRVVGRFGDKVSNLTAEGEEVYIGNVIGEVTAISVYTGRSRWIAKVGASVLAAPAVSSDRKWVAVGTTAGLVCLINNETGSIVSRFTTENEVVSKPLFIGDTLVAGSTDNHVYGWSISRKEPLFSQELSGDIAIDPLTDGKSIFLGTAGGRVHRFDMASRKVIWTRSLEPASVTCLVRGPSSILAGTSMGQLVSLDPGMGEVAWEIQAGKGVVSGIAARDTMVFLTLESGKVAAVNPVEKKISWEYQSDHAISTPPLHAGSLLFLGGATGKLQYIEVSE